MYVVCGEGAQGWSDSFTEQVTFEWCREDGEQLSGSEENSLMAHGPAPQDFLLGAQLAVNVKQLPYPHPLTWRCPTELSTIMEMFQSCAV